MSGGGACVGRWPDFIPPATDGWHGLWQCFTAALDAAAAIAGKAITFGNTLHGRALSLPLPLNIFLGWTRILIRTLWQRCGWRRACGIATCHWMLWIGTAEMFRLFIAFDKEGIDAKWVFALARLA